MYVQFVQIQNSEMDETRQSAQCLHRHFLRHKCSELTYLRGFPAHQNLKYHNVFDLVGTAQ